MNNYEQMAGVINYLNEHYMEQPSLEKLAGIAGLSMHHFQRKFKDWVGVTPKSFLQYLTLRNARELLNQGGSILDVAYSTGLSGASRLHDLCVSLEAASPGEIKRGGEGLEIAYGFGFSPFGECMVATTLRGIIHLAFVIDGEREQNIYDLQSRWPNARLYFNNHSATKVIQHIFKNDNNDQRSSLRAYVKGTKFQLRVWRALLKILPGQLVTYGYLAERIGQPNAARAVGSAIGKNPLAYLIPCHRVICSTGAIGHYHWGQGRKRFMITYESMQTQACIKNHANK